MMHKTGLTENNPTVNCPFAHNEAIYIYYTMRQVMPTLNHQVMHQTGYYYFIILGSLLSYVFLLFATLSYFLY